MDKPQQYKSEEKGRFILSNLVSFDYNSIYFKTLAEVQTYIHTEFLKDQKNSGSYIPLT